MTSNQKKIGIVVVAAIVCAIAFYFLYWIKTPVYSLGIIRDSIQKHDVATFEKHVDLDTLYSKGFDDALAAQSKNEQKDLVADPLTAAFMQMLKPAIISELKTQTLNAIKGDSASDGQDKKSMQALSVDNIAKDLKSKSGINDSSVKDVSVLSKENNEAIVSVKTFNKQLDKTFDLHVKMSKLDDGTWRLKEIANLADFLVEVDKVQKEKLAELNADIQKKMQAAVSVTEQPLKLVVEERRYFKYYSYDQAATIKNISDQDILSLSITSRILDADRTIRKEFAQAYSDRPIHPDEEITLGSNHRLNEYSKKDSEIISSIDAFKNSMTVTRIVFADGTDLHLLDKLPEPSEDSKNKT